MAKGVASPLAEVLEYYATPTRMTFVSDRVKALKVLPRDLGQLCEVVHGLLLHQHWARAYKVVPTVERTAETHIRSVDKMLEQICNRDDRPLTIAREPKERLLGVCRHFTLLLCTILRYQGISARARCGFGAYFAPARFEDHWVCEYWNAAQARWVLVDGQIDALQRDAIKPDFDLLDVPRDRFIIAGDAWQQCRERRADPAQFGIFDIRGLYFVAGNVMRDFAALNNMEMLPWDVWGAMFRSDAKVTYEQLALFDGLATLTLSSNDSFREIRARYDEDAQFRVPPMVFNVLRNITESV
jgi:Transglutaminase-like superfamily